MAINKNALIRYKVLDSCFRNTGKRYFIDDLIEACNKVLLEMDDSSSGISRRQIFQDIAFMESKEGWSIELEKKRINKKVYYRYQDTSFSINNMPLNEIELNYLQSAIDIISQFKGLPQFEWIMELIPKLKLGLASSDEQHQFVEFDSNPYLRGIEHIGTLYNSILYKRVLDLSYHPYKSDQPYNIILHPYFLKQYNNRWFLFGYNPENQRSDWNLALDRILEIKEINETFFINTIIDWSEYFTDIIGVTKNGGDLSDIILHFYGETGKYIESKPLHSSQKTKWKTPGILEVKLQLIINYEFEQLVLSYANNIKVISPIGFANVIKKRLSEGVALY